MSLKLGMCTCLKNMSLSVSGPKGSFSSTVEFLNQEEIIFDEIEKLAFKAGGSFSDFSVIVSVRGPGRFTGMRISYTLAKVYLACRKINVYGLSVHDCLAYNAYSFCTFGGKETLACISRAFKDEFYLSYYFIYEKKLERKSPIFWLKQEDLAKRLEKHRGLIIGEKKDYLDIYSLCPSRATIAADSISSILPEKIIEAGLYFNEKEISPIYAKPAKYEKLR